MIVLLIKNIHHVCLWDSIRIIKEMDRCQNPWRLQSLEDTFWGVTFLSFLLESKNKDTTLSNLWNNFPKHLLCHLRWAEKTFQWELTILKSLFLSLLYADGRRLLKSIENLVFQCLILFLIFSKCSLHILFYPLCKCKYGKACPWNWETLKDKALALHE